VGAESIRIGKSILHVKPVHEFLSEMKPNTLFPMLYIAVALYVVRFRMMENIVGGNEPEFYPVEIISTIAVMLTVILAYLVYHEARIRTGEGDRLYLGLVILFLAYYLGENNWLLVRGFLAGTAMLGALALVVFVPTLRRTYGTCRPAFWMFLAGMITIGVGTFFDATFDNESLSAFEIVKKDTFSFSRSLFEEVPELYASLFFLHAMFRFYQHTTRDRCSFVIGRSGGAVLVTGAIIAGIGNSFFLQDEGTTIWSRVFIGLIIFPVGVSIPLIYFNYFHRNGRNDPGKRINKSPGEDDPGKGTKKSPGRDDLQ